MSDIVTGTGMAHHAYRTYPTEQGQDPALGRLKAGQTASQTANLAHRASSLAAADQLYISPDAAQLYLNSLRKSRRVEQKPRTSAPGSPESATSKLPELAVDSPQTGAEAETTDSISTYKQKNTDCT
jgi:hypothetical protein